MEMDADADMTMDTNMLTLIVTGMTVDADTTTGMTTDTKDIITRRRVTKATITATRATTARSW